MIVVEIAPSQAGVISELRCSGHAGFSLKGTDIVCAAFTVLLRTWVRTCEASQEVELRVVTDEPGCFQLQVVVAAAADGLYRGLCWFFLRGLDDLAREYPGQITLHYQTASGRM